MRSKTKAGPDKGWSWVIAFCAFLISLILVGIYRTSGILLVAFLKEYGLSRKDSAWPLLLCFSLLDITGIIVGPLGQRFGIRPITIIGSLISAAGVSLCYFANSMTYLTVSFGIVFGIGFGLAYHLLAVIVNQYFLNHRGTANGIANSGACFGSLIFPSIYEYLIYHYGLHGCLLLIGGIILQLVVFACLLKPPSWHNIENTNEDITVTPVNTSELPKIFQKTEIMFFETNVNLINYTSGKDSEINQGTKASNRRMESLPISIDETQDVFEKSVVSQNLKNKTEGDLNYSNCLESFGKDTTGKYNIFEISSHGNLTRRNIAKNFDPERTGNIQDTCSKINIIPNNSVEIIIDTSSEMEKNEMLTLEIDNFQTVHLNGKDISKTLLISKLNMIDEVVQKYFNDSIPSTILGNTKENVPKNCSNESRIENTYTSLEAELLQTEKATNLQSQTSEINQTADKLGISTQNTKNKLSILTCFKLLLTCPMFYILAISNVFFFAKEDMFYVINVDFYMDKGVVETDTKYIIFAFSVCDLVGRLCFGWVTDRKILRRSHFMMICMAVVAVVFFCFPLAHGYVSLLILNCIYGLMLGCVTIIYFVIPVDYLHMEVQAVAFGCMAFMNGIVTLLFSFMIGYFRDHLGSYSNIFYIMGAVSLASSALWLLEKCIPKQKRNSESVEPA